MKVLRYCRKPGCDATTVRNRTLCDAHFMFCAEVDCKESRCGKSVHCKAHKNYNAKPDIVAGRKRCRKCLLYLSFESFNAMRRDGTGLQDRCKSCLRDHRLANDYSATWRAANKEHISAYNRTYERRMYEHKKGRQDAVSSRSIPFSKNDLQKRIDYFGGKCWICGEPWQHLDHVKPIKAGGWHALSNIRPACARCNRRKSSLWPVTQADLAKIRAMA